MEESIEILKNNLIDTKKLGIKEINELIHLLKIILKQNYFKFNNKIYSQNKGLAMGSPLSGIVADIFLNNFENKYIFNNINNKFTRNIIYYTRYIDDILVIFNGTTRQINQLLNNLNNHKSIKFTVEHETKNSINYLDLNINKIENSLRFKIYRKPTATDITIHAHSYHPHTQKLAAYNSFIHRLINVPMNNDDYMHELKIIKQIALANGYSDAMIDKLLHKHKNKKDRVRNNKKDKKFVAANFTNILPKILTPIFNQLNISIGYRTNNNIKKLLYNNNINDKTPNENRTGIYKLNCNDCDKYYIGQTGRSFHERFNEHLPTKNLLNIKSNFAKHIIDDGHTYTNLKTNLQPLHYCTKGRYMNAREEFEIYKENIKNPNLLLNNQLQFHSNYLYDTALEIIDKQQTNLN